MYKRKTDGANISTENLNNSTNELIQHKRKIRDAAIMFNIKKSTLHFHVKRRTANESDSGNDNGHGLEKELTLCFEICISISFFCYRRGRFRKIFAEDIGDEFWTNITNTFEH